MNQRAYIPFLFLILLAGFVSAEETATPTDFNQAMEKARKYTEPGDTHQILQRFIGTWRTETRLILGQRISDPERGVSETAWLMPGRWLQTRSAGTLMGKELETFNLMGYDNFKQSFVTTGVSSMDTAMIRSEGDLASDGNTLILYGTLDEYLTGEHDKMVKTIWRFISDDQRVMEVHDLPKGEKNTKVLEIKFTRHPPPEPPADDKK